MYLRHLEIGEMHGQTSEFLNFELRWKILKRMNMEFCQNKLALIIGNYNICVKNNINY